MKRPTIGQPVKIEEGIRRILAPNAGPMTHWGTNTWIVGEGNVAVIDPGPDNAAHLEALLSATESETITHILVTHPHADHSLLSRKLSKCSGAPVFGFGAPQVGRSSVMEQLSEKIDMGGGEGIDRPFAPDQYVGEGDVISGDNWSLNVIHTPGHFSGHLGFRLNDFLFSGDHVMNWASTLVSPPDGDVAAFRATSRRLIEMNLLRCLPGHGETIDAPTDRLSWLLKHRQSRENDILGALGNTPRSIAEITATVYRDVPETMHTMATRNVFAHLIDLWERNLVEAEPSLSLDARFEIC
ncbi:MAG: MBL fold metallo-hydrolase [Boseongicola sp.]